MKGCWVSVDGAKKLSGVAVWDGLDLLRTELVSGLACYSWTTVFLSADGVVIEDGYVGKNRKTGIVLGHARGKIEAFAEVMGAVLLATYQPGTWRRLVGVPVSIRRAQKQAARAMCRWLGSTIDERPPAPDGCAWAGVHFPILANPISDDECEAVLLGLAHLVATGGIS